MCPIIRNEKYHHTNEWYYEHAEKCLFKALSEKRLTKTDAKFVKEYTQRLRPTIGAGRYGKIVSMLVNVKKLMPCQFTDLTEDGFYDLQYAINTAKFTEGPRKGEPYSENTKTDWMKIVKRFYLYLSKHGLTKIPKETISELKTGNYNLHTKTEADVFTADEINRIVKAAKNERDRCYLSMLYESGARSIELANLRWRDIIFQDWGALITLTDYKGDGKPKSRTLPIVLYAKYLYEWRNSYPCAEPTGEKFVFISKNGNPINYANTRKILLDCARSAMITKHVSLHRFRHSRITHVLRDGMNETIAKKSFWGNLNTDMIETYCHLSTNDVASAYLELAGYKEVKIENISASPKAVQCPKCHHVSPPGTYFCPVCGTGLVKHLVEDVESAQKAIENRMMRMTDKEKIEFAAFLEGYKG